MMKARLRSNEEIREAGLKALLRDLGPEGLIRFLAQFGVGTGDYTRDRHLLHPDGDLDELVAEIKGSRKSLHRRTPPAG